MNLFRTGYPDELKTTGSANIPLSSSLWYQFGEDPDIPLNQRNPMTLASYVTKPKSGKRRHVVVMTTMKPFDSITVDDHNTKPTIMKTYDFSKGRADIVDQRMNSKKFSTKAK